MKKLITTFCAALGMLSFSHSQTTLDFDGSNDIVDCGTALSNDLAGATSLTVEAWVNTSTLTGPFGVIVGNYYYPGPSSEMQFLLRRDNDEYLFQISEGATSPFVKSGAATVNTGQWQHVVGTWDGSTMKIYVDGVEMGSNPSAAISLRTTTNKVGIGGNAFNEFFTGQIDNVRIWGDVRTPSEIAATSNQCLAGTEEDLLALYTFEDGTGSTVLTDETGNAYDGTLTNMDPATDWLTSTGGPQTPVDQTLSATPAALVCEGTSTVELASSEIGVEYYLRDDANDVIIDGPVVGTGSAITFNTGSISNTTDYNVYAATYGSPGNGISLDGVSKHVEVADAPDLVPNTGELTVEVWAKSNTANWNDFAFLLNKRDSYLLHPNAGSTSIMFAVTLSGVSYTTQFTVPDITIWHHYALSWDGTTLRGFVDGQEVTSVPATGILEPSTAPLLIGKDIPFNRHFDGTIDEARLWSVARSNELISSYYDKCLSGTENGLVMYLPMDETSGTVVPDVTGNGHDGIAQNITDPTDWVAGGVTCAQCDVEMGSILTVEVNPIADQTLTAAETTVCPNGGATTIDLGSSEAPVVYYLRDDSDNTVVDGPTQGTGSGISLNTGAVGTTTTYNVRGIKPENGIDLDGTDDIISAGNSVASDLNGLSNVTVEAWVKPETTAGLGVIAGNYNYPVNNNELQILLRRSGDAYEFYVDGGLGYEGVITSAGTVIPGVWQHVAGTWDGTTLRIYINGVELNSITTTNGSNLISTTNSLVIGNNAINESFSGIIDDVRIWTTTRTATEVGQNMTDCLTGSETGLIAYYKLNELSGSTLVSDASASGYDATLMNADASTVWTTGIVGCNCTAIMASTVTVTVEDVTDPVLTGIPANINITSNAANCEATVTWTAPTATDNCTASPAITSTHNSGDNFPLGTTTVSYTASDDEGNSATGSFDVIVTSDLAATSAITSSYNGSDVSCNGSTDGEATVSPTAGTSPYTYLWSDGQTTAVATGLAAGTYDVDVIDDNGCTVSASVTVTEPTVLVGTATATDVLCNGGTDGEVTLTVTGGTTNYSFEWDDAGSSTTQDLSGLEAGAYTVDITDANGCTAQATATVAEPIALSGTATSTNETNGNDGAIDLTPAGGTAPYDYSWTGPNGFTSTDQNPTGLEGGSYEVTITDDNGCTFLLQVTVDSFVGLEDYASNNNFDVYPNPTNGSVNIQTESNGIVEIFNLNGKIVYTTTIEKGETMLSVDGIARGVYTLRFASGNTSQFKKLIVR